jgi:hypothetical protein
MDAGPVNLCPAISVPSNIAVSLEKLGTEYSVPLVAAPPYCIIVPQRLQAEKG